MSTTVDSIAWHKGQFRPLSECQINIATHALQYGTMVFGGVRGYYNPDHDNLYLFRLKDHISRLIHSAKIMQMKLPLTAEEMGDLVPEIARRNQLKSNSYFRPFIYKSASELSPRLHNVEESFSLYIVPLEDYLDTNHGLRVMVSSWRRFDDNTIPTRVKSSGGYINSALAKSEALQNGFDEAIFLDSRGFVSEGSAENIFIVRNNQLITPSLASSILEGITRRTLIELAGELSIQVVERDIARGELYLAEEVFLCGTGAQVAWVREIDHRTVGDGKIGPATKRLRDYYINIVKGNEKKYNHWLTPTYASR